MPPAAPRRARSLPPRRWRRARCLPGTRARATAAFLYIDAHALAAYSRAVDALSTRSVDAHLAIHGDAAYVTGTVHEAYRVAALERCSERDPADGGWAAPDHVTCARAFYGARAQTPITSTTMDGVVDSLAFGEALVLARRDLAVAREDVVSSVHIDFSPTTVRRVFVVLLLVLQLLHSDVVPASYGLVATVLMPHAIVAAAGCRYLSIGARSSIASDTLTWADVLLLIAVLTGPTADVGLFPEIEDFVWGATRSMRCVLPFVVVGRMRREAGARPLPLSRATLSTASSFVMATLSTQRRFAAVSAALHILFGIGALATMPVTQRAVEARLRLHPSAYVATHPNLRQYVHTPGATAILSMLVTFGIGFLLLALEAEVVHRLQPSRWRHASQLDRHQDWQSPQRHRPLQKATALAATSLRTSNA